MKKLYLIFLLSFFSSCDSYYNVLSDETLLVFDDKLKIIDSIPSGVYYKNSLSNQKYRKIRHKKLKGYVLNPYFDNPYYNISNEPEKTKYYDSREKTVHVKAYTRKDGTRVKAYTRRPPRRK